MKIKAVFFDLFETLISEYSGGGRISNRNYNYMKLLGIDNEEFKKEWNLRQEKRMKGFFTNYCEVVRDILTSKGLQYDEEVVQYLYQERINEKSLPFRDIRTDIIELLGYLRKNKMKIGLISNCTEEEVTVWYGSNLEQFFNDYVFSFQVHIAKPDERIYKLACDRLDVEPEDCIFVGDGGSNELDGAHKAGLGVYHAVWFNSFIQSDYRKLEFPKELIKEIG